MRIFFHPDFTVGTGITPVRRMALADFTAGGELHPALKILFSSCTAYHVPMALSSAGICDRIN